MVHMTEFQRQKMVLKFFLQNLETYSKVLSFKFFEAFVIFRVYLPFLDKSLSALVYDYIELV